MATLEDLIAFNDEVAALARAGVPMEVGLGGQAGETSSSRLRGDLADSLRRGATLPDAVENSTELPRAYKSVVLAGIRCGRLPVALDALSAYARSVMDLRHALGAALVYPAIVCSLAYVLLVWSCLTTIPRFEALFASFGISSRGLGHLLSSTLPLWIAIPPLCALALVIFWYWSRSRSSIGLGAALSWLPGIRGVVKDCGHANMANLLALLLDHDVALAEGLRLATSATGDAGLSDTGRMLAETIERGSSLIASDASLQRLPPFLRWALSNDDQDQLPNALRLAARTYHHRAHRRVQWLRVVLPMIATAVIGGGITLCYSLSVFRPILQLIQVLT